MRLRVRAMFAVVFALVEKKMTCTRRFVAADLFRFNNVNLDPLTETVQKIFNLFVVQSQFLLHILDQMARIFLCHGNLP